MKYDFRWWWFVMVKYIQKNPAKASYCRIMVTTIPLFFSIPLIVIYRSVFYRVFMRISTNTPCAYTSIYVKTATIGTFYRHVSDLRECVFFIVFRHSNSVLSIWCSFKGCLSPLGWLCKQNETKHTQQQKLHHNAFTSIYRRRYAQNM